MRLRVGFLGMADNLSTPVIVTEFARLGRPLDVVFLEHPGIRAQWRRLIRKLKSAGPRATLQRLALAVRCRRQLRAASGDVHPIPWPATVHRVGDVNAEDTRRQIRSEQLDLLLVVTDSMLRRDTFAIPRLGTLNAHPGWLPRYRGLGSIWGMLRDGVPPAISVHLVDEGVDTGPVLIREPVDPEIAFQGTAADLACYREQARMFANAIALFEVGQAIPIDTFLEPSGMARAPSASEMRAIYAEVQRERPQNLTLSKGSRASAPHHKGHRAANRSHLSPKRPSLEDPRDQFCGRIPVRAKGHPNGVETGPRKVGRNPPGAKSEA